MKEAGPKILIEQKPKTALQKTFLLLEDFLNKIFTPRYNPFYCLGAISSILFIILVISGVYLFIFYRTNNPYQVVQDITEKQWYIGGIMRSIHRYSADGLIIAVILHTIREYFIGRYSHYGWLAWITGLLLLIVTIIIGITGYWLVWDERAQLVALKTSELLSDIPLFIEPISMSFLSNESLDMLLFFVLHLMHLALPVAMVFLIGLHIFRLSRPVIATPRIMTIAIVIMLFAASVIMPATSAPPADLSKIPRDAPFDWFYLFIYPLREIIPLQHFWIILSAITIALFILPWTRRRRLLPAEVILENCTGCEQCNKDCPYEAIRMRFSSDRLLYRAEATVISERCASCGVCVGACDFTAINLPDMTDAQINEGIVKLLSGIKQTDKMPAILLFICAQSAALNTIIDIKDNSVKGMKNVKAIALPCIGMVQPSMIERGFKSGADGVFLCGCLIGDCYYREGNRWLRGRVMGERYPFLSKAIDTGRIREYGVASVNTNKIIDEIRLFEGYLSNYNKQKKEMQPRESKVNDRGILRRMIAFSAIPAFLIVFFSMKPIYPFYSKGDSLIKLAIKYPSRYKADCRELTEKETEAKLRHMRKTNSPFSDMRMDCQGERLPINVDVYVDNKNVLSRTYFPTGLKNDGPIFIYEEIPVTTGTHGFKVRIGDSKEGNPLNYVFEKEMGLKSGEVSVINLSGKLL